MPQPADLEQAGAQPIVDVVVVVGDVVAQRGDLRLRPGMAAELEVVVLAVLDDRRRQIRRPDKRIPAAADARHARFAERRHVGEQ